MTSDDWAPLLDDLAVRHAAVEAMGGPERLLQLADRGRIDVRTRIAALVDPGSFVEYGALVGSVPRGALPPAPADAFVMGHATVHGRPVLLGAGDPTVMGGSVGIGTLAKRRRLAALAATVGRPLVLLLDGTGMRTRHPNDATPWTGDELRDLARAADRVPVVAAILGPVAGHDALVAAIATHVVMADGASAFGAGPPMVFATSGVEVTARELGGAAVQAGVLADRVAADERLAIAAVRDHLRAVVPEPSAAPRSVGSVDLRAALAADPSASYDLDAVLRALADDGTWTRDDAPSSAIVTGSMRIAGRALAVVANDAATGDGRIDVTAADAGCARLARAAADGEPVLILLDGPGPAIGPDAEAAGTSRAVARLLAAVAAHPGPLVAVVLRRAYGDVPAVLGLGPGTALLVALATPAARFGPLPAETASEAVGLRADVTALLEHTEFGGAVDAADQLLVDRVVDPDAVRAEIASALRLAAPIRG